MQDVQGCSCVCCQPAACKVVCTACSKNAGSRDCGRTRESKRRRSGWGCENWKSHMRGGAAPTVLLLSNLRRLGHSVVRRRRRHLVLPLDPRGSRQLLLCSLAVVPGRGDCRGRGHGRGAGMSLRATQRLRAGCLEAGPRQLHGLGCNANSPWLTRFPASSCASHATPARAGQIGLCSRALPAPCSSSSNLGLATDSLGPSSSSSACLPLLRTAGGALRHTVPCMRCSGCFQRLRAATGMRRPAHSPAARGAQSRRVGQVEPILPAGQAGPHGPRIACMQGSNRLQQPKSVGSPGSGQRNRGTGSRKAERRRALPLPDEGDSTLCLPACLRAAPAPRHSPRPPTRHSGQNHEVAPAARELSPTQRTW